MPSFIAAAASMEERLPLKESMAMRTFICRSSCFPVIEVFYNAVQKSV